jgi:hypothetical protein
MTRTVVPAALAVVLLAAACSGSDGDDGTPEPGPTEATSGAAAVPELGAWHELVTDPGGGVLLVNGHPEDAADPDPVGLWRWDGERWTAVEPEGDGPSARNFAAVAMDTGRDVLLLHGGVTPDGVSDETWEWDGSSWSLVASGDGGPGPRSAPSMAYDETAGRMLLYGGDSGGPQYDDTWAWDGTAWEQVAPDGPEPVRWPAFMEYDPGSGAVVLYGGHQVVDEDAPSAVGDTWVWAGDAWREVRGARQPGLLLNANGVAHPEHGLLLVGGAAPDTGETGLVWRWVGAAWEPLPDGIVPERQAFGVAYDATRDVVVLTGGVVEPGSTERHQDVWEWSGDPGTPAVQVPASE